MTVTPPMEPPPPGTPALGRDATAINPHPEKYSKKNY